ncbi:prepilin peptidase [Mycobacterium ostraviense]|uniref:Type IV prepilin leader peptidase n=1 Tax=Mycobacterium ostraviense TaxID=2738409 RepID=A0A163UKI4_9MYCO|nr:A24 family peptidase [Mycobacterium ostraviense]KZS56376.1 type IV prepilin leader peptidase [Mycobacterium ostraviense]UGT94366.1 A24 family peptidase [Mycobacterium ostraviense]
MGTLAAAVALWMAVLCGYDVRERRLPNALTVPGAAVILLGALVAGRGVPALAGAAALAGVYLLVHLVTPAAMGAGDIKLAVGVGGLTGCFGADVWFLAALAAPLLTAVCGLVARIIGGADSAATLPHGPSMCLATAGALALVVM